MRLKPGERVDRYVVDGILGTGGMAVVYRVRHESLDTPHALKLLQLPARSLIDRLLQEGRAQARLRHLNIVSVTDVIDVNGAPGLIMELIPGPTVERLLREHTLTIRELDVLGRGILDGMAQAHGQGLVHRDIKPANILVLRQRDELIAKVTDFGLAKALDDPRTAGATRTGVGMGTPAYMSPEQTRDAKNVDQQTDVFALGATLYEMATGRRAFEGSDTFDTWTRINAGTYPDLREARPDLPDRMVRAIEGALQVDPGARFASASELLACWADDTEVAPITESDRAVFDVFERLASSAPDSEPDLGATYDPGLLDDAGTPPMPGPQAAYSLGVRATPTSGFARASDGIHLAYQVLGSGEPLVFVPGFISHVELNWEAPFYRRAFEHLAERAQVVMYDKRGTGMSDRHTGVGSLERRVADLEAVLDAVGYERAHLAAVSEGGPAALALAALRPERVQTLQIYGSYARAAWAPDYPIGLPPELGSAFVDLVRSQWGTGRAFAMYAGHAPDPDAALRFLARFERLAATPDMVDAVLRETFRTDVRDLVPRIQCPTLIVHNKHDPIMPVAFGRWLADNVPHAEYIELDEDWHVSWRHDHQDMVAGPCREHFLRYPMAT